MSQDAAVNSLLSLLLLWHLYFRSLVFLVVLIWAPVSVFFIVLFWLPPTSECWWWVELPVCGQNLASGCHRGHLAPLKQTSIVLSVVISYIYLLSIIIYFVICPFSPRCPPRCSSRSPTRCGAPQQILTQQHQCRQTSSEVGGAWQNPPMDVLTNLQVKLAPETKIIIKTEKIWS